MHHCLVSWLLWVWLRYSADGSVKRLVSIIVYINKKHLKNVGRICHNELPHADSADVASRTVARRLRIDVHDDSTWQRGLLWPHGMGPIMIYIQFSQSFVNMCLSMKVCSAVFVHCLQPVWLIIIICCLIACALLLLLLLHSFLLFIVLLCSVC